MLSNEEKIMTYGAETDGTIGIVSKVPIPRQLVQYQSRSRDFLSLGINIGIDPEAGAFFARSWQNSY